MATPVDDNVMGLAKKEIFGIINFIALYYEKSASRNTFLQKRKKSATEQKFTESES